MRSTFYIDLGPVYEVGYHGCASVLGESGGKPSCDLVKGDPSQDRFLVSIAASDGMRRRHGENRRYNHNVARYDTSRKFRFGSSLTDQQLAHFDLTHLGTIIFHRERSLTASPTRTQGWLRQEPKAPREQIPPTKKARKN